MWLSHPGKARRSPCQFREIWEMITPSPAVSERGPRKCSSLTGCHRSRGKSSREHEVEESRDKLASHYVYFTLMRPDRRTQLFTLPVSFPAVLLNPCGANRGTGSDTGTITPAERPVGPPLGSASLGLGLHDPRLTLLCVLLLLHRSGPGLSPTPSEVTSASPPHTPHGEAGPVVPQVQPRCPLHGGCKCWGLILPGTVLSQRQMVDRAPRQGRHSEAVLHWLPAFSQVGAASTTCSLSAALLPHQRCSRHLK